MGKQLRITSRRSQETVLNAIESGLRTRSGDPLYEHLVGKRFGHRVIVRARRGILIWPGRGVFVGAVSHAERGSVLAGHLNGRLLAPLFPAFVALPALAALPGQVLSIGLMWGICVVFGLAIVRSDHGKIVAALHDATGN